MEKKLHKMITQKRIHKYLPKKKCIWNSKKRSLLLEVHQKLKKIKGKNNMAKKVQEKVHKIVP